MRPPEFTGGNSVESACTQPRTNRFNEAAGIHRRKHEGTCNGIHSRQGASMRPPEFTGGNTVSSSQAPVKASCFNEAAGIHRRKPERAVPWHRRHRASMRPPEFTGGNNSGSWLLLRYLAALQ